MFQKSIIFLVHWVLWHYSCSLLDMLNLWSKLKDLFFYLSIFVFKRMLEAVRRKWFRWIESGLPMSSPLTFLRSLFEPAEFWFDKKLMVYKKNIRVSDLVVLWSFVTRKCWKVCWIDAKLHEKKTQTSGATKLLMKNIFFSNSSAAHAPVSKARDGGSNPVPVMSSTLRTESNNGNTSNRTAATLPSHKTPNCKFYWYFILSINEFWPHKKIIY